MPNLVQQQALKSAASRQVSVPGDRTEGAVECCLLTLVFLLLSGLLCIAKDKPSDQEGADLLAKAASLQNLHEQGAQPFQLRMRIHSEHIVPKPTDGAYAEVWMAPNKWRREVAFPGFTQLEIGDVDSRWVTRNFDFRPRVVYLTEVAVERFIHPGTQQEAVIKSVRSRKVKGAELRCVELLDKEGKRTRELCFDGGDALVSVSEGIQRFEYSDFGKSGNKIFPKNIRVYESGVQVLDISADNLSAPSDSRDALFVRGTGARQMAECEKWPKLIKKIQPQYPPAARAAHQQGTVVLSHRCRTKALSKRQFFCSLRETPWTSPLRTRSNNGCIPPRHAERWLCQRKSKCR